MTLDSRETTKEPQYLPGASVVMETIEERLSPKIPEESLSYGPMPPTSHGKFDLLYPPQRSCRGVYWFHHVRPSVCRQILCRTIT